MKIAIAALLVVMALVVGGVLIAGPGLSEKLSSLKPEPDRTSVRVQQATPSRLVATVSAPGEIEPHTMVNISSQVSAKIEQLPAKEGQEVRTGDLVVKLDDKELKALLESSQARRDGEQFRLRSEQSRLQGLASSLEFAKKELERKTKLYETGDVSRKELDDATERVRDLEASVDATAHSISVLESSLIAAQADIDQAEDALSRTVILAPIDGVVTALNMEVGEQVLGTFNNMGSTIMTIADLSRMIMTADVAESDVTAVQEGQQAQIHINSYPDAPFAGTVTSIALQRTMASDGTAVFQTEIEIDLQGQRLRSGHTANVDIEVATHEGLIVESQAIVERLVEDLPDEIRLEHPLVDRTKRITTVVYTLEDGEAVCTPVRAGASDLTRTLVLEGIEENDVVVVGPYKVLEKIEHGERIRDEAEDTAEAAEPETVTVEASDEQPDGDAS